jgi:quaternary ammonium compound-resistance protein SugE
MIIAHIGDPCWRPSIDRRAPAVLSSLLFGTMARTTLPPPEELSMSWVILFFAGVLEVAWAVGLKYSAGFTRLWPSVFTLATMAGSIGLLGLALRQLPLGTAYAVWTGIGTVGTAIAGMIMLGEPAGALRLLSIALIVAGIVGLKILTPA